jgi:hypothetical protein
VNWNPRFVEWWQRRFWQPTHHDYNESVRAIYGGPERRRDARGFPLSASGQPIEAVCAACGLPMITLDDESYMHDCDCLHRKVRA